MRSVSLLSLFFLLGGVAWAQQGGPSSTSEQTIDEFFNETSAVLDEFSYHTVKGSQPTEFIPDEKNVEVHHSHKQALTTAPTAVVQAPVTYTFSDNTTWTNLNITVIDYHTHFHVHVDADLQCQKWDVKNNLDTTLDFSGGVDNVQSFGFDVPRPFSNNWSMTVYVISSDGMINPAYAPLRMN